MKSKLNHGKALTRNINAMRRIAHLIYVHNARDLARDLHKRKVPIDEVFSMHPQNLIMLSTLVWLYQSRGRIEIACKLIEGGAPAETVHNSTHIYQPEADAILWKAIEKYAINQYLKDPDAWQQKREQQREMLKWLYGTGESMEEVLKWKSLGECTKEAALQILEAQA